MAAHKQRPPDQTARVAISGTYGDATWTNVFWGFFAGSLTMTFTQWRDLLDDIIGVYFNNFLPVVSNEAALTGAHGTLYTGADTELSLSRGAVGAGGVAGTLLPADVSTCVSWLSPTAAKGGRPRTYLPPPSTGEMGTEVRWDDSHLVNCLAAGSGWLNDFNALTGDGYDSATFGYVVFRRNKAWLDEPFFNPILGVAMHLRIANQRHRLGRYIS